MNIPNGETSRGALRGLLSTEVPCAWLPLLTWTSTEVSLLSPFAWALTIPKRGRDLVAGKVARLGLTPLLLLAVLWGRKGEQDDSDRSDWAICEFAIRDGMWIWRICVLVGDYWWEWEVRVVNIYRIGIGIAMEMRNVEKGLECYRVCVNILDSLDLFLGFPNHLWFDFTGWIQDKDFFAFTPFVFSRGKVLFGPASLK